MVFGAWACHSYELDQSTARHVGFLIADRRVVCTDGDARNDAHEHVKAVAWPLVVLWPVGVPSIYIALLVLCRGNLVTHTPSPLSRAISFLHSEYKPEYFWWEAADLLRKIILVGWLLLIEDSLSHSSQHSVANILIESHQ